MTQLVMFSLYKRKGMGGSGGKNVKGVNQEDGKENLS